MGALDRWNGNVAYSRRRRFMQQTVNFYGGIREQRLVGDNTDGKWVTGLQAYERCEPAHPGGCRYRSHP